MNFVEKYQTVFVAVAIVGGLAVGQVSGVLPSQIGSFFLFDGYVLHMSVLC